MDGQRFDELARLVATGVPRRRVLGMFAGGVAAVFSRVGSASAGICLNEGDPCDGVTNPCCGDLVCDVGGSDTCVQATVCIGENGSCGVLTAGGPTAECCEGLECVDGTCVSIEPVCAGVGEACSDLAGPNPSCCLGLICVQGFCEEPEPVCAGVGEGCIQPSGETNLACCEGLVCVEGICDVPEPVCAEEGDLCGGKESECCESLQCINGLCAVPGPTCSAEGETCSIGAGIDLPCCEGLDCFDGICVPPPNGCADEGEACELDDNCCAGICCAGFCRDIECCIDEPNPNDRCDDVESCFEGVCQGVTEVCESDEDCDDDTCCCEDGGCSEDCCGEPVTQLPGTGAGASRSASTGLFGAAAAAAAALLAGKKLRETVEKGGPTT